MCMYNMHNIPIIRCVKTKDVPISEIRFGYKISEPYKNLSFPTETACNTQFKLTVTKTTLLAFNVQIKNVSKHDRNRV